MSDQDRLRGYVEVWWQAIHDFARLLEKVPADQWQAPTDLPGWNVHDIAAHVAHLEAITAGGDHDDIDVGSPDHVTGIMGQFTEQGVVARKDRDPDELIAEIRQSATRRHTHLLENLPTDPSGLGDGFAAIVGWTWERLLRNRPLDVWMHEQDIRRAIGLPGDLDSAPAKHTADYLLESMSMVVGKRVAPPPGTTILFTVAGSAPYAVSVGDDHRAHPMQVLPSHPTVALSMSREDFIVAAGGRRAPSAVTVNGDERMAELILDALVVTP